MIKPLYLDSAIQWQVRLDDGPALNVSAPGRARSLYPLQRLARVISPSHASWATPALVACLRAGVPVVFHDSAGAPVGWCFGPRKRETTLGSLLREALSHPRASQILDDWVRASTRREMMRARAELQARPTVLEPGGMRSHLCNLHRQRFGLPMGPWLRALQRANAALVAQRLHELVSDPALIGHAREGLHLGQLLCDLMQWRLHCLLHAAPVLDVTLGQPDRFAAALIERQGSALHRTCGELAGSLEHHLREQLT